MEEKALWNIFDGKDDHDDRDGESVRDGDGDGDGDGGHLDPYQACWCQDWCPPAEPSSSTCELAFSSLTSRSGPQCLKYKIYKVRDNMQVNMNKVNK